MRRCCIAVVAVLYSAASLAAAPRRIPFWPDTLPELLQARVDGVAVLETVRELARFHRVHGSPGYTAAAEHMRAKLVAAGLADAHVERFAADGNTRYAHFRSYFGWTAQEATLEEVSPTPRELARFPDLPVALADYSQDADVTAELVDVGEGTAPRDYEGRDLAGRIVVASGPLPLVHRMACELRGAAGLLSDFPNQTTAWSGDDRDLVRWGHLSPYQVSNRFAFMLSKRQAQALRARLSAGEKVIVRARVRAKMAPASYEVVVATIAGLDPSAGEVLLTAHLCHQSAGANDNASGSAAILEVARVLQAAVAGGALPRPRRGIRFLWLPEIAGAQAYAVTHPELAKKAIAGIHMDMVGGVPATIRGSFHLSRTAESRPHVVNEIARAWFDDVMSASARHAERGGEPRAGLVWPPGSREAFAGDVRGVELGSDHQVFQEASFGIPMVYFHDWPDVTIHTNKDQPENLDATKLGRVVYLGAGVAWTLAALPEREAPKLLALASAAAGERAARARLLAALLDDPYDAMVVRREAAAVGGETLRSLAAAWPSLAEDVRREAAALAVPPAAQASGGRDARVPVRDAAVRGPLDVYYYDHLAEALGASSGADVTAAGAASFALAERQQGDVLAYEALNLVDGRRTVAEIRDVLSGRYAPIPVSEVGEYFDVLARAAVVRWRPE
jgi:aminopeptidase YwaD